MSDRLDEVRRAFAEDRFATANGIELVELGPGFARARVAIEDRHLNCFGLTHGGVLFTLAAVAAVAASNTGDGTALGVSMSLSCLKPTRSGVLLAEATEVSRSRRLSTCSVRVTNEAGHLVALFQGTAYVKGGGRAKG